MRRVGVLRLDSFGDVLLSSPVVRAVADAGDAVTFVCSRRGRAAAELLPGVAEVVEVRAPWIDPEPDAWTVGTTDRLVNRLAGCRLDVALVLTSFHQSPLPAALVLREAGVREIHAVCSDYPGSLLDGRVRAEAGWHEVERGLAVARSAGYAGPRDRSLLVVDPQDVGAPSLPDRPYVVVHPGASVPSRSLPAAVATRVVDHLTARGWVVVVTGTDEERALTAEVAHGQAVDLTGSTDAHQLAEVLRRAEAVVVGNTGAAHLAAAVGTPVVSVFSPVVPWHQWRPWHVPTVRVGPLAAPCTGSRARRCPAPAAHCLDVDPGQVVAAVTRLAGLPRTGVRASPFQGAA